MRVIAGALKGRRLGRPRWEGLRPTSDKLRETLFNVLGPDLDGARVLDGYAGTGAIGIEALSRGAGHVTFVDSDRRATDLIARNLALCRVRGSYSIIRSSLARAAARLGGQTFDLVVLDPPYATADLEDVVRRAEPLLALGGRLVLEHPRRRAAPARVGHLLRIRQVVSGDSVLSFYAPIAREPRDAGAIPAAARRPSP